MAYAEKRDGKLSGFWYGEVLIKATSERFRRRFETKREAVGYEAYVKATGFEPPNLKDAKVGMTFADAAAATRASNSTWKRGRDQAGQQRLDWVIGRIGPMSVANVTTSVLDGLVRDLEKRPAKGRAKDSTMAPGTINRYLSAASAVLTFARARDPHLPSCAVPWKKEAGHRLHWYTVEQEEALVRWLTAGGYLPEALAIRVLCATGLRWGEFLSVEAYSCQGEWIKLDKTKTDTPRDVPIDAQLCSEFCAMIRAEARPNYVQMGRHLKLAVKACGYSPKLGIHNMRHTTATRLIKNGAPLPIVQRFLGHKDIKTTMKYVHVEADDLMSAMKNLLPRRGDLSENVGSSSVLPFMKSTG
jgi:integrase